VPAGGITDPPSTATLTDLAGGIAGLPVVAFGLAILGAVALALVIETLRSSRTRGSTGTELGLARRRDHT
jgi:hypothetical protein